MGKKYRLFLMIFLPVALLGCALLLALSTDLFFSLRDFHLSALFSSRLLDGLSLLLLLSIFTFLFFALRKFRTKQ